MSSVMKDAIVEHITKRLHRLYASIAITPEGDRELLEERIDELNQLLMFVLDLKEVILRDGNNGEQP